MLSICSSMGSMTVSTARPSCSASSSAGVVQEIHRSGDLGPDLVVDAPHDLGRAGDPGLLEEREDEVLLAEIVDLEAGEFVVGLPPGRERRIETFGRGTDGVDGLAVALRQLPDPGILELEGLDRVARGNLHRSAR